MTDITGPTRNYSLIGVNISLGSFSYFIERIMHLAKNRQSSYVCVANSHMLVEAHLDKSFSEILNAAAYITPDGMPLTIGIKMLSGINQDRVAGMDLLPHLLRNSESQGVKVFFYGGTADMQMKTANYVSVNYPKLKTTGFHSPPFRPLTTIEEQDIVERVNTSETNIVFVALGCPKQEKWMASMEGRINACMIGVGGALPVMIGMQERAPVWMQKNSLEWLYRLYQEPGRLWKRYFYTNSLFLWLFSIQYLKYKFLRK